MESETMEALLNPDQSDPTALKYIAWTSDPKLLKVAEQVCEWWDEARLISDKNFKEREKFKLMVEPLSTGLNLTSFFNTSRSSASAPLPTSMVDKTLLDNTLATSGAGAIVHDLPDFSDKDKGQEQEGGKEKRKGKEKRRKGKKGKGVQGDRASEVEVVPATQYPEPPQASKKRRKNELSNLLNS